MKPTFEQRANLQRVSFLLGLATIDDVIGWADAEIEATTVPPSALIDLSLGRKLPQPNVVLLLNELAIETGDCWSTQHGMSRLAEPIRSNKINVPSTILHCYRYLRDENLLYDDAFIIFVTLEDDLSLIRDGILGDDQIPKLRDKLLATLDKMESETRIV